MGRGMREDIRDNPHTRFGRIDIGITHHELFEDIVLNSACELFLLDALFFGGGNIKRQNWQHRAVHSHRDGHFIQWNLVK